MALMHRMPSLTGLCKKPIIRPSFPIVPFNWCYRRRRKAMKKGLWLAGQTISNYASPLGPPCHVWGSPSLRIASLLSFSYSSFFYPKRSVNRYISWTVAAYITLSLSFQGSESQTLCSSRSFWYSSWQVLLWLFTPDLKYFLYLVIPFFLESWPKTLFL